MLMYCVCVFPLRRESFGLILDEKHIISEVVVSHITVVANATYILLYRSLLQPITTLNLT
jgi:hypothetical protein